MAQIINMFLFYCVFLSICITKFECSETNGTILNFKNENVSISETPSEEFVDSITTNEKSNETEFDGPFILPSVSYKSESSESDPLGSSLYERDVDSISDITQLLSGQSEPEVVSPPVVERVSAIQRLSPQRRSQNEMKKRKRQNDTDIWNLEELLDVYSPHRLAEVWNKSLELRVTEKCKMDMEEYLEALRNGELWALKMMDSSGRYGGSFLFGNTYWIGSATLCDQVQFMTPKPSFRLGFFTLRVDIMLNKMITAHERSQLLGVCLPYSCTSLDVDQIVELSAQEARLDAQRSLELVTIKSPHNFYDMNADPLFTVLIVSSAIVLVLLIAGTALDYYLEYKLANKSRFTYDNYTFVFSKSSHHRSIITGPTAVKVEGSTENNNGNIVEPAPEGSETTTESNSVTSDESDMKISLFNEILLSFSVRRNMNTICDRSVGVDTIPTIHGLRSLSMAWVILGHTCIVAFKYSDNMSYRGLVEKEFMFQTINKGAFSVDTFFFISGLLVSFLYFRTTAKHDFSKITRTKGIVTSFLQFIGMIGYRFGRLSTPYLFVLGVVQISMKWFYYNSVFEPPAADHINCPNYWWRNLLYINTLFPVKDMCMLWSWYLADDTQFYILGAVLLIMAVKNFRVSASLMVLFLIMSWITTMYIAYTNDHMPK
uniref:Nose resistant-to-fluoxetine protein N-terminal domain-containing protein n=1 Tax=Clastoptera arizonana TaxID=38151 RepID=A0A1B6DRX4_9HEMI